MELSLNIQNFNYYIFYTLVFLKYNLKGGYQLWNNNNQKNKLCLSYVLHIRFFCKGNLFAHI